MMRYLDGEPARVSLGRGFWMGKFDARTDPDPFQNPSILDRAVRGGCWYEPGHRCLSTTRISMPVRGCGSGVGFRVALVSTEP
jgi:hypothetical protein